MTITYQAVQVKDAERASSLGTTRRLSKVGEEAHISKAPRTVLPHGFLTL